MNSYWTTSIDSALIIVVGPVGINVEHGRRDAHWFPVANHGEAGAAEPRKVMDDTGGGGHVGSSGYSIGCHLHWTHAGGSGPVGSAAPYL